MAEAVFQNMVKQAGLENQIEADSAGTGDWHVDSAAHPGTLAVLRANNIPYEGRARALHMQDLKDFDYIATMDDTHLRHLQQLQKAAPGTARVAPLLEFGEQARQSRIREVPDPYFTGGFDTVYSLVLDGCAGLLETIIREHGLGGDPLKS